ncbi:MAG: DNA polymerase III subunit delta [Lentisphaeria bacterium]|nr:DNA polymerase III subunit delta [Lentisphaeria bacterium]
MGKFYIISGDDDFARKQRARETAIMAANCEDPENADHVEVIQADLPELKPDMIADRCLDALRTPPFLAPEKVVWLRHHPDLDSWSFENAPAIVKELVKFLSEPLPPELSIVIDGPGVDKRKTLWKNLIKAGAVIEVLAVARATDRNFAENRRNVLNDFAKSTGKRIRPDAMQYLIEVIGGDSGILANELDKLASYTGNANEITIDDCRAIVSRTPEAVIWEYTEAIQNGRCEAALRSLALLSASKDPGMELKLIALLSNAYQKSLNCRLAMQELGITRPSPGAFENLSDEKKAKFPDNPLIKLHPYRAFKMCETAMRLDGAAIAGKLTLIRNANRALVSGGGDSRIILEQLTLKLCL